MNRARGSAFASGEAAICADPCRHLGSPLCLTSIQKLHHVICESCLIIMESSPALSSRPYLPEFIRVRVLDYTFDYRSGTRGEDQPW
jgi:hypothetical protein